MARPAFKKGGFRKEPPRKRRERPDARAPEAAAEPHRKLPPKPERASRPRHDGPRLPETIGMMLERAPSEDFELVDTGDGRKLERYGSLLLDRPEAQALWQPALPDEWAKADAVFTGDTDEEGAGRWQFAGSGNGETWPLSHEGVAFHGRFTAFRHVGVFPEQAPHWKRMTDAIRQAPTGPPVRVLNLFGYTGLASLLAAEAGAQVTHVDASKKAIGWARENAALAGLENRPIRWICDDAMKFCEREVRRGRTYDVVLLDPPAFGRGPKGEVWQFFEDVPHLVDLARAMQGERPLLSVLTSYAIRASHLAIHELMQECFGGLDGRLESGELILRDRAGRALSTSMFARFVGTAA